MMTHKYISSVILVIVNRNIFMVADVHDEVLQNLCKVLIYQQKVFSIKNSSSQLKLLLDFNMKLNFKWKL